MKAFSLFSGIGGFDLALKRNGVEIVGTCEIDKYARSVYGKHFAGVKIWENATTINPKEIPDHSIFVAGFPCQPFSMAGNRGGFNDTRGTLFFEIQKIVEEKQPSILLLENVLGLLSHEKGRTFATILDTLDALRYDVEWQVLNSKNYGVAQNRERVFIVGHSRGKRARKIFPIGGNDEKDIGGQIKLINKLSQCNSAYDTSGLMPALNSGTHGYATGNIAINIQRSGRGNGNYETRIKRVQKRDTIWTLGTSSQRDFGLMEGTRLRRLTPLECERLQGFPDNWTAGHSDTQRYKMLGYAVTVPVVEYLVQELVK